MAGVEQEQPPAAWQLITEPRLLTGFAYGFSYPSVFLAARMPATSRDQRSRLAETFEGLVNEAGGTPLDPLVEADLDGAADEAPSIMAAARWFAMLATRLTARAKLPVIQPARVVRVGANACTVAAPSLVRGLAPLAGLLKLALEAFAPVEGERLGQLRPEAQRLFGQLLAANLTTSNTPRLVKAAVENGIAFQELPGTVVVQYGLGRKAALFDSTFTHVTPNIGARFARQKHEAAAMLRRSRIPVPDNALVFDEQQALSAADQLGYPVVVKPADKDGGLAVRADLRSEDELLEAYAIASAVSAKVLVEKFVPGRDYRLTVFRDRCIWAVERQPAGVTGDGARSIAELVASVNRDPNRGEGPHSPLKVLKLDEEALGLLTRDQLTPDTVPAAGTFVRLRRASNVSSGGMPIAVFDQLHPDNARLAVRAARTLRLDLAGIDLLIPDISVSWKEGGAAICEVNGQPELGGTTAHHLYPQVLNGVLQGDGHVPTIAIVGGPEAERLGTKIAEVLQAEGLAPGVHNRAGIHVGSVTLEEGQVPQIAAGRMLAGHQAVEALVFAATNEGVALHGFPVPRIDLLVLTGERLEPAWTGPGEVPSVTPMQCLQVLLRNSRALVMLDGEPAADPRWKQALASLRIEPDRLRETALLERAVRMAASVTGHPSNTA